MTVRGKFKVQSVTTFDSATPYAQVKLAAQYSGTPEDNSYSKATPTAELTMTITVPEVIDFFKPGAVLYADFSQAD